MDRMFDAVRSTIDHDQQVRVLMKMHEKFVDDALFVKVNHDVNPRAMSPSVEGFVQAQSWDQRLSPVFMPALER